MSFHSEITAPAVWPADLVAAGIVSSAGHVYTGRRPQAVTSSTVEVWLERLAKDPLGAGMSALSTHGYSVHVICRRGTKGSKQTGQSALDVVEARTAAIVERYHGAVPFLAVITDMDVASATEDAVDNNPEAQEVTGTVRVQFHVRRA